MSLHWRGRMNLPLHLPTRGVGGLRFLIFKNLASLHQASKISLEEPSCSKSGRGCGSHTLRMDTMVLVHQHFRGRLPIALDLQGWTVSRPSPQPGKLSPISLGLSSRFDTSVEYTCDNGPWDGRLSSVVSGDCSRWWLEGGAIAAEGFLCFYTQTFRSFGGYRAVGNGVRFTTMACGSRKRGDLWSTVALGRFILSSNRTIRSFF